MFRRGFRSVCPWKNTSHGKLNAYREYSTHAKDRPIPTAPRALIDVKSIRQNPDLYARNCVQRNYEAQSTFPFDIVTLFRQWQELDKRLLDLRRQNHTVQSQLSQPQAADRHGSSTPDSSGETRKHLLEKARQLKEAINAIDVQGKQLDERIQSLAIQLPNLTSPESPSGTEAKLLSYLRVDLKEQISKRSPKRDHVRLGAEYDLLDFSGAGVTSGWGWYYLKGEAALLEQALVCYAIKVAMKHGFSVVTPPSMTYSHIASACGFRPRDRNEEQQIYTIQQNEADLERKKPTHCLAGTAEIPLAGMKANTILEVNDLPLQVVGSSRCYRAEAGARGAQTKGLYRVHEFTKVEMFAWTRPEASLAAFEKMVQVQKEILEALGLYCRVLEMPPLDLGASAVRKQDIETYLPSRDLAGIDNGWGEVTSASICTDYQSRRLSTRVREGDGLKFVHTVNGTALAVPRVLAALLEYGAVDDEDIIQIPEVLWPWMNGITQIKKRD